MTSLSIANEPGLQDEIICHPKTGVGKIWAGHYGTTQGERGNNLCAVDIVYIHHGTCCPLAIIYTHTGRLFVCVNTFSRDKVVVPVLLRLSLSLTLPPSLPFTPSQWFGFYKSGQDKDVYSLYESDIWTKVWLLFVKRNLSDFSITYPVVVPTASFRILPIQTTMSTYTVCH